MPDNEQPTTGDGMLTQDALDALLAAAAAEEGDGSGVDYSGMTGDFSEELAGGDLAIDPIEAMMAAEQAASAAPHSAPPPVVHLPSFDPPAHAVSAGAGELSRPGEIGRVRDIPLELSVELGRTRLLIRDILELGPGSIIELDKIAGEPVDLFANGMLVARGEVVVIDDNFGVRVTEIITAAERTASIAETEAIAA